MASDLTAKQEDDMLEAGRERDAEARQAGQDYIQFYQAGFLDATLLHRVNKTTITKKKLESQVWELISKDCKKAFELRFMKKIGKELRSKK